MCFTTALEASDRNIGSSGMQEVQLSRVKHQITTVQLLITFVISGVNALTFSSERQGIAAGPSMRKGNVAILHQQ